MTVCRCAALCAALAALGALSSPVDAQRRGRFWGIEPNVACDGRFTFARIRYTVYGRSGWEFDYPTMERNLMTMMGEITALRPHVAGSNIHALDDPELLKYPVAYLSEPGYWIPSESEVLGLRTYLAKGGFLIVDDFMRGEWRNFESQMSRVLPGARIDPLDLSHPVFHEVFDIETLDMSYPHDPYLKAEFLGIHQDNNPSKRLIVVINYNNDIGDYMEWSGQGWWAVNISNEAYKLAINYIIYGMTH
ncbi:MAG TPA: DUF4159 domain-containing protein [Gemmatimonadales bacterium]|nr:DUF4159 domain-containing protein [Gemmatimonadales bacterium]